MLIEKNLKAKKIAQRASFIKGMKFSPIAPPPIDVKANRLDLGYADANIPSNVAAIIEERSKFGENLIWIHTGQEPPQAAKLLMERNLQKDITNANPKPFKADVHIVAKEQLDGRQVLPRSQGPASY